MDTLQKKICFDKKKMCFLTSHPTEWERRSTATADHPFQAHSSETGCHWTARPKLQREEFQSGTHLSAKACLEAWYRGLKRSWYEVYLWKTGWRSWMIDETQRWTTGKDIAYHWLGHEAKAYSSMQRLVSASCEPWQPAIIGPREVVLPHL